MKKKNNDIFARQKDHSRERLATRLLHYLPATQEVLGQELNLESRHLLEILEYLELQKKIVRVNRIWRAAK